MRSSVGSVGNSCPRSIFDSMAGDRPVCSPSWTSPSFFLWRRARTFGPIPYRSSPAVSVSESIPPALRSRPDQNRADISTNMTIDVRVKIFSC